MADGSVTYELKIDDKGATSAVEKFKNQSEKAGDTGQKSFFNMDAAALKLKASIVAATAALAKFMADAVETGMNFDKSISQVAATMRKSVGDETIQNLREQALELGRTTQFSAQQAADGVNILAQAGLNEQQIIAALPEVLNLAAAGNLDLATSANYVTGAFMGFGDVAENAQYYTDLLAVGASSCKTDVNQLGAALSTASSTASAYNQTAEGTTLALMRLAQQNVTGAEAATAMNRAMMDLYTPTSSAKKQLDALGVSVYDAEGNARDFNTVVDELNDALSGMSDEEKLAAENAIFSTFGLQAFNKMTASSTDTVDGFKAALQGASGAAGEMAETQLDNLAGDITMLQSAFEGLQIQVSDLLVPTLRMLGEIASQVIGGISSFIEEHNEVLTNLANLVGGVLRGAVMLVAGAFDVLLNVLGVVLEIISPLIEALSTFVDIAIRLFQDNLTDALEAFGDFMSNVPEFLSNLFEDILLGVSVFCKAFGEWAVNAAKGFVDNVTKIMTELPGKVGEFLASVILKVAQFVSDMISGAVKAASEFMSNLKSGLENGFNAVVTFVTSIPQKILDALGNLGSLLWNAGSQIISGFFDGIRQKFEDVKNFVSGIGDWIASHKGPEQYDKTLLIKQGGWIMESLATGLENGRSEVLDALKGITADISGYTIDANLQPSASSGVFNNTTIVNINGLTSSSPSVLEAAGNLVSAVQLDLRMGVA